MEFVIYFRDNLYNIPILLKFLDGISIGLDFLPMTATYIAYIARYNHY